MPCCGNPSRLPGIRKQISELAMTTANVLSYAIAEGKITAEKELVNRRIEKCQTCEHLINGRRCSVCGCWVSLKAALKASNCPLKYW